LTAFGLHIFPVNDICCLLFVVMATTTFFFIFFSSRLIGGHYLFSLFYVSVYRRALIGRCCVYKTCGTMHCRSCQ